MFGKVEVRDRIWSSGERSYLRPLPGRLGVAARGRSRRLERVLADFGSDDSFVRAAWKVREHYGFTIGASAARDSTLEQAGRARELLEGQYRESYRLLPAEGAARVVAQADGTMIRTVPPGRRKGPKPREWKEARLTAARALGSETTVYAATFAEVGEVGRRLGHCARGAGRGLHSLIHMQGDGAEWIRRQCAEVFGGQATFLCDFFHVSEYLAAAAKGRGTRAKQWRTTQQNRLKRGDLPKVLAALAEHLEPAGAAEEEAPVRAAHRYLTNRLDCLDYPAALALGLPIGSGLIESGHRHVLQARLKKAGTAWLLDHADRIAHLRVLKSNHLWESFWN